MSLSERLREAEAKRIAQLPYGHISATCGCCGLTTGNRAAKRDYWNSPKAARLARVLEWAGALAGVLALLTLGSMNF